MLSNLGQWKGFAFWLSAILVMVLASLFYQPAAARTGSLLVWTDGRVYVMDIDTLNLTRVAPADSGEAITPSPGCSGQRNAPCWVLVESRLYRLDLTAGGVDVSEQSLPLAADERWADGAVSWSPDGRHLAYSVETGDSDTMLKIFDAQSSQVVIQAEQIDSTLAAAWRPDCAEGLRSAYCEIGYRQQADLDTANNSAQLVAFAPATEAVRQWPAPSTDISELRWSADGMLLYDQPSRHFNRADDHSPVYTMPSGGKLASLSPTADHTVYYQPFRLQDCTDNDDGDDDCLHLGVWLTPNNGQQEPSLLYNVNLSEQQSGLNFVPSWTASGNGMVFIQDGKLVHYDLARQEATIWYHPLGDKLRSLPVFAPDEEAVAFVDNLGQGYSEYRLLVVNPRLQPVEHIIQTERGFKVLAWLN